MLGLRFCARAFSSCSKRGPLFITVCGPLTIAASVVVEHRLQMGKLSSCGSRARLLRGMWDLPRPGLEPVSPALAGRFSTTALPGKPLRIIFDWSSLVIEVNNLISHIYLHVYINIYIYIQICIFTYNVPLKEYWKMHMLMNTILFIKINDSIRIAYHKHHSQILTYYFEYFMLNYLFQYHYEFMDLS